MMKEKMMKQIYEHVSDDQYSMKDAQVDIGCCSYDTGIEYDEISDVVEDVLSRCGNLRDSVKYACVLAYLAYCVKTVLTV